MSRPGKRNNIAV